jgi:hypothetical protein
MHYQDNQRTNLADNFAKAAAKAGGGSRGRLLKFSKGTFLTGDDEVKVGTKFIADVAEATYGWSKFVDGKLTDKKIVKVSGGEDPPSRKELGDNDQADWETDRNGPRDPWTFQWYLPLTSAEDGESFTFVSGSRGGEDAIGTLLSEYAKHLQRGDTSLPIVKIETSSYKHKNFGRVVVPVFRIVGWQGSTPNHSGGDDLLEPDFSQMPDMTEPAIPEEEIERMRKDAVDRFDPDLLRA